MDVEVNGQRGGRLLGAAGRRGSRPGSVQSSVSASLAGKAVEMVTLVLLATVVPRVLGPDDYGRFSVPLTIVTLGSLAMTLGGPTLMTRFVPDRDDAERLAVARAIGARLARGRAAQLVVVAVAGVALVLWDADAFPAFEVGLVVVALALNVATTLALQIGLGLGRAGAWSARFPLQNAVLVVAVLVLHAAAPDRGDVLAIGLSAAAGAAFAAWTTWPLLRTPVPRAPVPDGAVRFGALQATGAALVQFSHRGGVLAVAVLGSSTAETGYAALATGIALGVTYAVLQTFTVSLPHLVAAAPGSASTAPGRDPQSVLDRLALGMLALAVPAAVAVALLVDDVVPAVFGDDYTGAVDAFVPAMALVLLSPVSSLLVQVGALRLRPEVAALSGAASAATFAAVALVAVPAWGAAGATSAALAGAVAGALVAGAMLRGAVSLRVGLTTAIGAASVLALGAW